MDEVTSERLAEQIAQDELGIQCDGGSWSVDMNGNDVWDGDYTEEECETINRIAEHILKTFNDTDWNEIANNEKLL